MKRKYTATLIASVLLFAAPALAQDAPASTAPATTTLTSALPSSAPAGVAAPAPTPVDISTYRLDTGDTILVTVDRHGDVSRTVPLLADATVLLPRMSKPIPARGMTCGELAAAIHKGLNNPRAFVLKPGQVTVTLAGQRMRRIYVRGNAVHGGDFDLRNGERVSELVAVMGGVPQPDRVHVLLTNPLRPAPIHVDLDAALASNNQSSPANLPLMEGDTLDFEGPRTKILFIKGEGPRGLQTIDERFTMKQALVAIGLTHNNQPGELRKAKLFRHTVPGDPSSPTIEENIDLVNILTKDGVDHDLKDYDTIEIPLSLRTYYVWGELGGARKRYLPEDRPTYLLDVMSDSGNTTPGQAKIGDVLVHRRNEEGMDHISHYDYGKFLRTGSPRDNPVIEPGDIVVVPNVKRPDTGQIWTAYGFYGLAKSFFHGLP